MGHRPSADIFYGLPFDPYADGLRNPFAPDGAFPEDVDPSEFFGELEHYILEYLGVTHAEGENYEVWTARSNAALAELGIEGLRSGAFAAGELSHFLVAPGYSVHGDWDDPEVIDVAAMAAAPTAEWDSRFKTFCAQAGIPYVQPQWLMAVSFG